MASGALGSDGEGGLVVGGVDTSYEKFKKLKLMFEFPKEISSGIPSKKVKLSLGFHKNAC